MKRISPNFQDLLTARFTYSMGRMRKLRRWWGTTTIDGIEVFKSRCQYYPIPPEDSDVRKVLNMLRANQVLYEDYNGIDRAWLYLSRGSMTKVDYTLNISKLQSNLYRSYLRNKNEDGWMKLQVSVIQNAGTSNLIEGTGTNTAEQVRAAVQSSWNAGYYVTGDYMDPYVKLLATTALLSDYFETEIDLVVDNSFSAGYARIPTYTVLYKIKAVNRNSFYDISRFMADTYESASKLLGDTLVREYVTNLRNYVPDNYVLPSGGFADMETEDGFDELDDDTTEEELNSDTDLTYFSLKGPDTGVWYKGHLRADFVSDRSIRSHTRCKMLFSCIKSDYKKKKESTNWFSYVAAVLIIVIMVILAVFTAGTTAFVGVPYALGMIITIATIITVAALYISLSMMALSLLGLNNVVGPMGEFMKFMDPLVTIAGIIAVVAGFTQAIKEGMNVATEKAAAAGTTATVGSIVKEVAVSVVKTAISQTTGIDLRAGVNFQNTLRTVEIGQDYYNKHKMRDLQKEIRRLETDIAKLEEADEKAKTDDILKAAMVAEFQVLAAEKSYYAELYDRPYEAWMTPYHSGCSQATSVKALWLQENSNTIDEIVEQMIKEEEV
jgi:hypothetical protein